jgi:DNA-binding transcriptional regulator YiaG
MLLKIDLWSIIYPMKPKELKAWRGQNDYSQAMLAKELKIDVMTVSRWERGIRAIPPFLHLALECIGMKGGEPEPKGKRTRKEKGR